MNEYFSHPYLSNSDIKRFQNNLGGGLEVPENLQAIFDLGTLIHAMILEPQHADKTHEKYSMAKAMSDTWWADPLCRDFSMAKDFEREKEIYEEVVVGPYRVKMRCKCDGARMGIKTMAEIKGLAVTTEKAFREALLRFDYDQAIAHYMITGGFDRALIVGISKKDTRKLFKYFVKKNDNFFAEGEDKLIQALTLLQSYSPEDVITI